MESSEPKNTVELVGDAQVTVRYCDTELGKLDESIQLFNNDAHELQLLVKSVGFPFFMRSILGPWQVFEENSKTRGKTEVEMDLVFHITL